MTDKRQVIYDIERCTSHVPDACRDCSHYTGTVGFGCMEDLMSDALALLKEHEDSIRILISDLEDLQKEHDKLLDKKIPLITNGQEVVRCKDCKWNSGTHDFPYCQSQNVPISPDWFCAGGERTEKLDG